MKLLCRMRIHRRTYLWERGVMHCRNCGRPIQERTQ